MLTVPTNAISGSPSGLIANTGANIGTLSLRQNRDYTITFHTKDGNPCLIIKEDGTFQDGEGNTFKGLKEVHDVLVCWMSRSSSASDDAVRAILGMSIKEAYKIPIEDIPKHLTSADGVFRDLLVARLEND